MSPRTRNSAKQWVDNAVLFYKAVGRDIALAEFSSPNGQFNKDQMYVFVLDSTGVMLAHGVNERYAGKDFYRIMDFEGKTFIKEIVDMANAKGSGWVEYKWLNPMTRTQQHKEVYFVKVDDMIICSGVYTK